MANVKTTRAEWEKCREYFEAGLSLSKISQKTGISKTQISKRSNREGWSKGTEKERLIADAVRVKVSKGTLRGAALEVHDELVDERVRDTEFFNRAAIKNLEEAMNLNCDNQNDCKTRADTILKAKEVVLGKTPEPVQLNQSAISKITYEVI